MSSQNTKEIISETVSTILEKTAFMFPEPADLSDGVSFDDLELISVNLSFNGEHKGKIIMVVPVDFCAELAANLLGEDIGETNPEENNFDSAKEMLNIVAGQLLTNLYGDKALINLTPPEVNRLEREELFKLIENHDYACSMVDEYPVITMLSTKEEHHEHKSISS